MDFDLARLGAVADEATRDPPTRDFPRWMGYQSWGVYMEACEDNPRAVMARLRRRVERFEKEESEC